MLNKRLVVEHLDVQIEQIEILKYCISFNDDNNNHNHNNNNDNIVMYNIVYYV